MKQITSFLTKEKTAENSVSQFTFCPMFRSWTGGMVGDDVGNLMCSFDQTALGDRVEGGIQTSSINDEIRESM